MGAKLKLTYEITESVGGAVVTRKFELAGVEPTQPFTPEGLEKLFRQMKKADQENV